MTPELMAATRRWCALPAGLLAVDFDGTIAPLVEDPASSRPSPATMEVLHRLVASGLTCAVVSGRAARVLMDLSGEHGWPDGLVVVGSHGVERGVVRSREFVASLAPTTGQWQDVLAEATAECRRLAAHHPGVRIEEKPFAVAVHTRSMPSADAEAAESAAMLIAAARPALTVIRGKAVVELVALHGDKGSALLAVMTELGLAHAAYVGDDRTDEDAFAVLDGPGSVTVKVGPGPTLASFRLQSVAEVSAWLSFILHERSAM